MVTSGPPRGKRAEVFYTCTESEGVPGLNQFARDIVAPSAEPAHQLTAINRSGMGWGG